MIFTRLGTDEPLLSLLQLLFSFWILHKHEPCVIFAICSMGIVRVPTSSDFIVRIK